MIVYWIAATYVLAGVYSAQLTSEFARPARESPINTLSRLQKAMIDDGYQLFVEKESSSLDMLEVWVGGAHETTLHLNRVRLKCSVAGNLISWLHLLIAFTDNNDDYDDFYEL